MHEHLEGINFMTMLNRFTKTKPLINHAIFKATDKR